MRMRQIFLSAVFIIAVLLPACSRHDISEPSGNGDIQSEYPDWSEETHGSGINPNFEVVFPSDRVLRIDIKISEENWTIMQNDLQNLIGTGGRPGGLPDDISTDQDPIWVECSVFFEGKEWYHVGIRYKGNSSLISAYRAGNNKLSFKLDFDRFEDQYPLLTDQRFYGFEQLNLNNNFEDQSLMREKVGADLFRNFGLVSSHTSFCILYIDHGNGPEYFGVYTIVEEVDDTVIKTQFNDGSGNLYKPEGNAATFAAGTFNINEMYKKTNESNGDYSDVQALYEILNSDLRTSDSAAWKQQLESVFNVEVFLKWLAANTTIQNWDTYGKMPHNYYLYHNPETDKLVWIPWDNNEAFQDGKMGGALSLSLNEVGANWPLIRYLIDVPEYRDRYKQYLNQFVNDVFNPDKMNSVYDTYYSLLQQYAYNEQTGYTYLRSPSDFDNAVNLLKNHVQMRAQAVSDYLNQN